MLQGQYRYLIAHFEHSNLITMDDIYEIADEHDIKIFTLYREIIDLIKKNLFEKVNIINNYDSTIIVKSKDYNTEFAIVRKVVNKSISILNQDNLDNLLSNSK